MACFRHPQLDEAGYVSKGRRQPLRPGKNATVPGEYQSLPFITSLLFIREEPPNHD